MPSFLHLLLQAAEAPAGDPAGQPQPDMGGLKSFLPMIAIMFVIFYLLVFRPEGKKRKERQLQIANLKKGDTVVTTGGIIGKVWRVEGSEMEVVIDEKKDVTARFAKSAVFEVLKDGADKGKSQVAEPAREVLKP